MPFHQHAAVMPRTHFGHGKCNAQIEEEALMLYMNDYLLALNRFLPLGVASCCASIQLVPYDSVNRNKVSIRQLPLYFPSHYMFRHLWAIFRLDIQLDIFKDYF
jgi:hypothetical protein